VNIFDPRIQGIEILPIFWLIPGQQGAIGSAALGLWYRHADGTIYTLPEGKLPRHWNCAQWVDYVVKIVKSPHVVEVGQIGEFLGISTFWEQHIELNDVQEFINRAYTAPVTITPEPTPPPGGDTGGSQQGTGGFQGGDTDGSQQGTGGFQGGDTGETQWRRTMDEYMKWGAIGLGGLVLVALLTRDKKKRRK
jgi:hypothetical protein